MTMTNTTRRGLIRLTTTAAACVAGASIVSGGAILAGQAKGAALAGVSPGLALALRTYADADRRSDAYHTTAYEPARLRYLAAREATPHTVLAPLSGSNVAPAFWSTDNREAMAVARALAATNPRTSTNPDHKQARNLVAADHRRNRQIRAAGKASGIDACRIESDRLGNLACDAANAVRAYLVATLADSEAKLAFMVGQGIGQGDGDMALVLADARRLLGNAGA